MGFALIGRLVPKRNLLPPKLKIIIIIIVSQSPVLKAVSYVSMATLGLGRI